jgi:hypothetical protein
MKHSLLLFLCINTPLFPVVTCLEVWHNPHTEQSLYVLHDYHIDYKDSSVGTQQQTALFNALEKFDNALVIAEDAMTYQGSNPHIQAGVEDTYADYQSQAHNPAIASHEVCDIASFLSGIITQCQNRGIACYNAECRHFFYLKHPLPWNAILDDFISHLGQLMPHVHHPLIARYYDSIQFLINRLAPDDTENLNQIGYHLVNATIIAQLLQSTHNQIFLCIGQAHAQSLEPDLFSLGFQKIAAHGTSSYSEAADILKNPLDLHATLGTLNGGTTLPF